MNFQNQHFLNLNLFTLLSAWGGRQYQNENNEKIARLGAGTAKNKTICKNNGFLSLIKAITAFILRMKAFLSESQSGSVWFNINLTRFPHESITIFDILVWEKKKKMVAVQIENYFR